MPSGFILDQLAIEELFNAPGGPVWLELEKIGKEGVAIAQRFCPAVTGALRDSIRYVVEENGPVVNIGSDLDYAAYVEFGTSRGSWDAGTTEADPFLRPMLMVVKP